MCSPFLFCVLDFKTMNLVALIEPTLNGLGYELVDIEMQGRVPFIRLFIDKQPEGVSLDDCVLVSNQLSKLFEVEQIDFDRLEVSSPGLDRPLKKLSDFHRFQGSKVQLKLRMPIENRKKMIGVLLSADEEKLEIQLEENQQLVVPMSYLDKARLVPVIDFKNNSQK